MKELLKKTPLVKPIFFFFLRFVVSPYRMINIGLYTTLRTIKYAGFKDNAQGWQATMRVSCHIIEKGLTMPERRLGFGQGRVLGVINEIITNNKFENLPEVKCAVGLINEYDRIHKEASYELSSELQNRIDILLKKYPSIGCLNQIKTPRNEFFSYKDASFPIFANSRHSIRNFSGNVSLEQINNSIDLALTAPSACNRQAVKCHVFTENDKVQNIMSLQNGNRGFGHLVSQLCLLTVDLRMIGKNEQNDIYMNAGIFAMNLSYAFHYNEIGSCILNWSVSPKQDKLLRKVANISNPESIVAIIVFGEPSDELDIARSQRKKLEDTLVYH